MTRQPKRTNPFTPERRSKYPVRDDRCKILIVGPVTGIPESEQRFDNAQDRLDACGYLVINPYDISPDGRWLHSVLRTLEHLEFVDGVACLDGYQDSRGSCIVIAAAERLEIPVMTEADWEQVAEELR